MSKLSEWKPPTPEGEKAYREEHPIITKRVRILVDTENIITGEKEQQVMFDRVLTLDDSFAFSTSREVRPRFVQGEMSSKGFWDLGESEINLKFTSPPRFVEERPAVTPLPNLGQEIDTDSGNTKTGI
jgi:hypothetical protein